MLGVSFIYSVYDIRQIRNILSQDTTKTLLHAFITSKLENLNNLLNKLPKTQLDCFQRIQNAAAGLRKGYFEKN